MKILIIADIVTPPIDMGNKRVIIDLENYLKSRGYEVHYLYIDLFWTSSNQTQMIEYWGGCFHCIHASVFRKLKNSLVRRYKILLRNKGIRADDYYFNKIHRVVNELHSKYHYDCCIVNYFYLSKVLTHISYIPIRILLTHDVFSFRNINTGAKCCATTPHEEAKAIRRAPVILAIQKNDACFFHVLSPTSTIYTTYNRYTYTPSAVIGNNNILFLSGSALFNLTGIRWFIEEVFPLILISYPSAKLIVGGKICELLTAYKDSSYIRLVGYVEDVQSFYEKGDIVINPTYLGSGLKIKTFESVSYDKVTIARTHSSDGIYDENTVPIYFSDDPQQWSKYISDMWQNIDYIITKKRENRNYIESLNQYIDNQYDAIFKI